MNEPKIRFKRFCGEWSCAPFTETFDFLKNNSLSRDKLALEGEVKNIHYGDVLIKYGECVDANIHEIPFVKDSSTAKTLLRAGALQNGDVVIADAAEDNSVGKCSEVVCDSVAKVVSGLHTIPIRPKSEFASRYLGYYMNSPAYHNQLLPHIQGSKISSISKKAVGCTNIVYPKTIDEQRTLASFFTSLDAQISASSSRLASLKQVKAASLQAMFPQEGETVPKVRFKGFLGEWKKVKLGEIFCERTESNIYGEMLSVTQHNGIIKASENGRFDNSNSDKSNYKVVMAGDIAYNSMRMWQGASGYSPYEGIVSPAYTVIIPQKGVNSQFFAYLFKTESIINTFRLHSQGLTSDTWNLKYPAFSKIEVRYPIEDAEQQAIATFFTSLDRQIALQSQRLEKLKQIKSACLDKMFV